MALERFNVFGHTERPWGYEVRVDFQDTVTGHIYNEVLTWREHTRPDEGVIETAIETCRNALVARIAWELAETQRPVFTDRTRLDGTERLLVRSIIEVNVLSDHVAGLTISAANKAGIQVRLAVVKATLVDALVEARRT